VGIAASVRPVQFSALAGRHRWTESRYDC
jgi:hypothetical protein